VRRAAIAIALGLTIVPRSARAEEEASTAAAAPNVHVGIAALGMYHRVTDLSAGGGGLGLTFGTSDRVGLRINLVGMTGRTAAGLLVYEIAGTGGVEWELGSRFRIGTGGGIGAFSVRRATTKAFITNVGFQAYFRLGYDFARPSGMFVLVDLDTLVNGDIKWITAVWGPTAWIGYRF
jgi:hypothetical protein